MRIQIIYIIISLFLLGCSAEIDPATAVTSVGKMTIIFEFIMALLPLLGGLACIISGIYFIYAGLTGDIQLIVEANTLSMKLVNASPGMALVALGVILLWRNHYKVKIRNTGQT